MVMGLISFIGFIYGLCPKKGILETNDSFCCFLNSQYDFCFIGGIRKSDVPIVGLVCGSISDIVFSLSKTLKNI